MDGFETPYEDCVEVSFINCEICNKSIRGESLYKLHLTSQGHLKNEEALIAEGKIPRQQFLPVFEDIIQYLEYLNLDEPIIGLGYLVEVPGDIGELSGIKYHCTLCNVYAYINEAVQHVIGRKHRQKYLEKNRPDLVNWDSQRPQTITGKIIRAKANIAERQDGQGKPKPLPDKTQRRLLARSSFQGGPKNDHGSGFTNDMGPPLPKFGSFSKDLGRQVSEDYMQERYEDTFGNREPLGDSEIYTERYKPDREHLGYPGLRDYEREGSGDFSKVLGLQDQDRRQYSRSERENLYTDEFRQPPAQKDVLKEFYTEELRREQLAKAQKWPNDVDSHQQEHTRRPREIGPGANHSSYPTSIDGKNSHEMYKLIQNYRHDALVEHSHEALSSPGLSRVSPSRSGDFSRKMSNIPDPFMRFLKGESSQEEPKVRKRKSRFSDATAEELQTAHEKFADDYGPPDPKFPSLRPEIREPKTQQTGPPRGLNQTEAYQKDPRPECSESTGDVFDMLKNIEIENEEEANFLKERLCSVLREFKARKAEKAAKMAASRSVKDYSNTRPVTLHHTQDRYGRTLRENVDISRAEEPYDPSQGSYDEQMLDDDFQEHTHPVLPEARYSNRKSFKEINRWSGNNQPQRTSGYDMPAPDYDMPAPDYDMPAPGYDMPAPGYDMPATFPETFQEPLRPRDYQSADNFSDYKLSTSHTLMERGPRMKPPQYSRNLDKITSTLLELVKRK